MTGVQEQLGGAEISEDDLELDEEDMDEELVEAVREVLRPGGQDRALERKLDMAAAMKSGVTASIFRCRPTRLPRAHPRQNGAVAHHHPA